MVNPYCLMSEQELLDQYHDLLAEDKRLRTGLSITSDGRANASFSRQRLTDAQIQDKLSKTIAALQAKNPTAYGKLVTETYSDFSGTDDV